MSDSILTFAKILVDQGIASGLTKDDFNKAIEARAAGIRKGGETAAKAYTRAITDDDEGRLLYRAYKVAPAPVAAPAYDPKQDYVESGPAETEMREAVERHRADAAALGNKLTYEQSFARVYADPAHLPLKQRYDRETLAA